MESTDRIGRRLRFRRSPRGEKVILHERDYEWFSILHRHGPLPTTYLHEFTKHRWRDYRMASRRLSMLFHESGHIDRPWQQFETLDPRSNDLVHILDTNGVNALREGEHFSAYAPASEGTFKHQLMVSCITASFELEARERGWRYIAQHELLSRAETELVIDVGGPLRPDAMFALEMGGKFLVFFLEADRATEPLSTKNIRKSWRRNVVQYGEFIGRGVYRKKFNLKAPAVLLNVTISNTRLDSMIRVVQEELPNGCAYVLGHTRPEFGSYFKPPGLMNMLGVPWRRAGYPPYIIGAN